MSQKKASRENESWTSSRGVTVKIVGISPVLITAATDAIPDPDPPTKSIPLDLPGSNVMEEVPLNDDTAETDEERRELMRYREAKRQAEIDRNRRLQEVLWLEGVEVEMDDIEQFERRMKRYGIPFPEDPDDLKLAYINNHVIGSPEDLYELQQMIMTGQGLTQEDLEVVQRMFRAAIRREERSHIAQYEEQMESEPNKPRDASGESLGHNSTDPVVYHEQIGSSDSGPGVHRRESRGELSVGIATGRDGAQA